MRGPESADSVWVTRADASMEPGRCTGPIARVRVALECTCSQSPCHHTQEAHAGGCVQHGCHGRYRCKLAQLSACAHPPCLHSSRVLPPGLPREGGERKEGQGQCPLVPPDIVGYAQQSVAGPLHWQRSRGAAGLLAHAQHTGWTKEEASQYNIIA